jgi:hypothetical protein
MADQDRDRMQRAGGFIGDVGVNVPVPIKTLSDEYHDTPEPVNSDVVPPREPEGLVARVVHSLQGKHPHADD